MPAVMKRKSKGGFYRYLLARGSTFAYLGLLAAGLTLGSLFCISEAESSLLLRTMISGELALQATRSFPQLIANACYSFIGIFVYIYVCVNSLKGNLLICIVPVVHGLSLGAVITTVLWLYGYNALSYILLCIFVPKAVETLLLLSVCNKTIHHCRERSAAAGGRKNREGFPILLYLVLFSIYFLIESAFIYLFRGLL